MIIHHTSSLLILLRAFQRSYSELLEKDTSGRLRLSQSKQPRSAATATAQPAPGAKGQNGESPSKYPLVRTYGNKKSSKILNMRTFR
jgi:hypothetical protein